jgi:hypothetical protein
LQSLYNTYKANPSADTLQKIESISARITAAVNLILTSVSSFASLIPQPSSTSRKVALQNTIIPQPKDLKRQWNQQV